MWILISLIFWASAVVAIAYGGGCLLAASREIMAVKSANDLMARDSIIGGVFIFVILFFFAGIAAMLAMNCLR